MDTQTLSPGIQEQIVSVFKAQQAYAPELAKTSARQRLEKLDRMEAYLREPRHYQELLDALYQDFRKPPVEVDVSETGVFFLQINHIRKNLRRWMAPRRVATPLAMIGTRSHIICEPKGVSLIMSPWNYPLNLTLVPLAYAIAAGNTALVKPSEMTGNTSAFIRRMLGELFEEREVAVFEGDASVAQALLEQPVNHIFFTGSPQVGKIVMAAAAKHLASVTLELGGKSPVVIDETAKLDSIAEKTLWGKCLNAGQTCIAPDYLLVQESVSKDFIEAYRKAVERLYNPAGKGIKQSPDLARIVNTHHFRRLRRLLDDAVSKGAQVQLGGETDEQERYMAPTLLTGLSDDMAIMQEEIFGPLLPMLTFRNREEVIEHIRRRPKPLTMYINSRREEDIRYYLQHTSAGGTVVNDYMLGYGNPELPFGGVNNSGIGKSFGYHGFAEFSNERSLIRRHWSTLSMIYPPYTNRVKSLMNFINRWLV